MLAKRWLVFAIVVYVLQFAIGQILDYSFLKSEIYKSAVINSQVEKLTSSDILIFGGSNGLVSFDNRILEERTHKEVYNLSEDDTNLKLHLLQLKLILNRGIKPERIILVIGSMEESLSRNFLRYLPYLSHDEFVNNDFQKFSKLEFQAFKIFPIFKWAKYNNDLLYPTLYSMFLNKNYHHRFDSNGDYEYPVVSAETLENGIKQKVELNYLDSNLVEFKNLCLQNGIALNIVNTPFLNKEITWNGYGEGLMNFSSVFGNNSNLFYDAAHINKNGKLLFSNIFADSLIKVM
jgi:hypothetical protein